MLPHTSRPQARGWHRHTFQSASAAAVSGRAAPSSHTQASPASVAPLRNRALSSHPAAAVQGQTLAARSPVAAAALQTTAAAGSVTSPPDTAAAPRPATVAGRAPGAKDAESTPSAAAAAGNTPKRWDVLKRKSLADGTLELIQFEGDQLLRVWTPAGFSRDVCPETGHPVLVLNDGQNLFEDSLSFSGASWRAAHAASDLIRTGDLPPFVIIGIDHSGATRSFDYCPVKPGTGPQNFRSDAKDWPGGGNKEYLDLVMGTILPWATAKYNLSADPQLRAFGGSSFGGICTLCMCMAYPGAFGSALVESPSLWIDNEKFLKQTVAKYAGAWPSKMFLAMGGQEYSGIRAQKQPKFDKILVDETHELVAYLESVGLDQQRLKWTVSADDSHTESAWARRLPSALSFLCQHWWKPLAELHKQSLLFTTPLRPMAGHPAVVHYQPAVSGSLSDASDIKLHAGFNRWSDGNVRCAMQPADALSRASGAEWLRATVDVPAEAFELNTVFSNADESVWDDNMKADFWARVDPAASATAALTGAELLRRSTEAARGDAQETAHAHAHCLYFTRPARLVAGAPAAFYFNRKQSHAFGNEPNQRLHYGFDGWNHVGEVDLKPTSLWRDDAQDWWAVEIQVPEDVTECNFAFTDGHGLWENNGGNDYVGTVTNVRVPAVREVAHEETNEHAGGTMHVLTLEKPKGLDAKAARAARWTTEKTVRVWTPPGFDAASPPPGGWPVIIFNDGQNKFEDWLAHQGVSWKVGECAAGLIASGRLPPFVVAAVDNSGPMRSLNYLPYAPGTGEGGFRGDAERWPGGGVQNYMERLVQGSAGDMHMPQKIRIVDDILPMLRQRYGLAEHPSRVAFGGGSFGGVCALYAAMHYGHVFGAVLAESPSLWIAEGRFLGDLAGHTGPLPERIFMGCGTREYSATRDHDRDDVDALLLHYYQEAARLLGEKGMRHDRLRFQVEEGAGHHELAWAWRLTGGLEFLLQPWWGRY